MGKVKYPFYNASKVLFILLLCFFIKIPAYDWLSPEVGQHIINLFESREANRTQVRGTDRRSSSPFISGDGFRDICQHICDESNRCRFSPENVKDGECIFVKTDFFEFFVRDVTSRIKGKYVIITHNGDLSAPDGQDDAPRIGMPKYVVSDILEREFNAGRLIAHHAQNLWWTNNTHRPRPPFLHCLPIGIEDRQYPMGKHVHRYIPALMRNVVNRPNRNMSIEEASKKPLILIAFYPKSRIPDRQKVLHLIGAIPPKGQPKPVNPFYNETDLSHDEWLDAIVHHRFVLAPFGHGLDTHRLYEIFLMGGIPVTRRSTITSCYDDSDNVVNGLTRGKSLPIVILDSWKDLTKERLEMEWQRIVQIPKTSWDWKRLIIDQWFDRIQIKSH